LSTLLLTSLQEGETRSPIIDNSHVSICQMARSLHWERVVRRTVHLVLN
jgi:hypothetical protein